MDAETETCVDVEYWTKLDDGRIECGVCRASAKCAQDNGAYASFAARVRTGPAWS